MAAIANNSTYTLDVETLYQINLEYMPEKKNCQLSKKLDLANKHWLNSNYAFLDCLWQGNLKANGI